MVVTADSNLIDFVITEIRSNELYIGVKKGSFSELTIDVYCPIITSVSVSDAGKFQSADKIAASTFTSNVSGSGKIEANIESENCLVKISGSGKITITGNSTNSNIDVSGSGNFSGNNFEIKNAAANISGAGKASVFVTDNLKATVSDSGKLNYRGESKVDTSVLSYTDNKIKI